MKNYVQNLRVAEEVHFIFDGEDIQIFDLETKKEVRLTYEETIGFSEMYHLKTHWIYMKIQ